MISTRRQFLATISSSAAAAAQSRSGRKPNIILFMCDDAGIDLFGCYGADSRFKTPNIDALARNGIRFETCYSAPLCGPTRGLLMTGRYAFRTGGINNGSWREGGPGARSADEYPMAKMLEQAGYATCMAGKWRQVGETPGDWGFDEWLTDPTANGWFWQKSYTKNGQVMEFPQDIYAPDHAHDFAMDFMRRNSKGPFFLYHSSHLVHGPILPTPDSGPDSKDLFADNVAYLDKMVGKVVAEVKKLGIRDETIILFTGDNGTAMRSYTIHGRQVNGAKGSMWEGGTRVPLIVSGRGVPKGKVLNDMVDFSDFHATFAELAGATRPSNLKFDGRSFAPRIAGKKGNPREWIYVQLGANWYVKDKAWKLNQGGELYDMRNAPIEEKLVAPRTGAPDAEAARKRLDAVLAELNPRGGKVDTLPAGADQKKKKKKKKAA